MKPCFCKIVLGILVIVFAWWSVDWANIALTVLGAILILLSMTGSCCCKQDKCECEKK